MTRTNRFLYGVGWGYVNQFVMAAAGLYLTRFYLQTLGDSNYGLWIVGLQFLAYLTLLDLGVVALLPRETAYVLGNDRKRLPKLIADTVSIALAQTPALALMAAGCWYWLPSEWALLRGPLACTFTVFVISFPLRAYPAVLQGLQDFSFLGKTHFVSWALGTAASVAGLMSGLGLYSLVAGWVTTTGILFFASLWRLKTTYANDLPSSIPAPTWAMAKARLSKSLWVTLSQISQVLLVGTDVLVLGKLLGPQAVVVYTCTSKLVLLLSNQPLTLTQSAMPGLSELKSSRDAAGIRRVSEALTLLVLLFSGAIASVVLAVNGGFVNWWVGANQYGGDTFTALVVANMVIRHYATTLVYSLFCFGHERALAFIGVADGGIVLGLSVLLVPHLGPAGPIAASLAGALAFSVPVQMKLLAKDLGVGFFGLLRPLGGWSGRFAVLAGAAAFVLFKRPPVGPVAIGAVCVALAAVYGLFMLPVFRSSALLTYVQPVWDKTVGVAFRRAR